MVMKVVVGLLAAGTVVGFAVMYNKMNKMSATLAAHDTKINKSSKVAQVASDIAKDASDVASTVKSTVDKISVPQG
jgi:hypothetical protein